MTLCMINMMLVASWEKKREKDVLSTGAHLSPKVDNIKFSLMLFYDEPTYRRVIWRKKDKCNTSCQLGHIFPQKPIMLTLNGYLFAKLGFRSKLKKKKERFYSSFQILHSVTLKLIITASKWGLARNFRSKLKEKREVLCIFSTWAYPSNKVDNADYNFLFSASY